MWPVVGQWMGKSGWPRYDAPHVPGSVSERMGRILGHINALTAELVDLVKVVGDEDRWHGEGIRSIEHFLQWRTGFTRHHVTQLLKVAASQDAHPTVCAHLADGVLTLDQAALAVRAQPCDDRDIAWLATVMTLNHRRRPLQPARPPRPPTTRTRC